MIAKFALCLSNMQCLLQLQLHEEMSSSHVSAAPMWPNEYEKVQDIIIACTVQAKLKSTLIHHQ